MKGQLEKNTEKNEPLKNLTQQNLKMLMVRFDWGSGKYKPKEVSKPVPTVTLENMIWLHLMNLLRTLYSPELLFMNLNHELKFMNLLYDQLNIACSWIVHKSLRFDELDLWQEYSYFTHAIWV